MADAAGQLAIVLLDPIFDTVFTNIIVLLHILLLIPKKSFEDTGTVSLLSRQLFYLNGI